jgi:antirestriction protein ArdC
VVGIDNSTIDNSVAYIGGWLRKLKSDNKMIVQTAGQAQKGADYILGVKFVETME